jgi:hypothetical protein
MIDKIRTVARDLGDEIELIQFNGGGTDVAK